MCSSDRRSTERNAFIAAFDDGSNERVALGGPNVPLSAQVAVSLGMAIHELTTNAAKFGALSVFGGKVEVTWSVTIDATRCTLAFDWVESEGPPVVQPQRQGFSSRLLAFVLPGQFRPRPKLTMRLRASAFIARFHSQRK